MNDKVKFIEKNVCAPRGFKASGIACGIKKAAKPDLALIYSEVPAAGAGVFTQNKIKAAPLLLTQQHLKSQTLQAIITNSGNANACTGKVGLQHAAQIATTLAKSLQIAVNSVAVSSTGIIGVPLPIDNILSAVPELVNFLDENNGINAAESIMTTDTFSKETAVEIELSRGEKIRIGGIAKGSGMIHPNMATMLCYITTDADIAALPLQKALTEAANNSFNLISVDGDSSTNDMVLIMANKCAENKPISDCESEDWKLFYNGLLTVCVDLAKKITRDGEGATKLITVNVTGAVSEQEAKQVAKSVVSSSLVKTAVYGNDANWGRIACAVGYSNASIDPDKLLISLDNLLLFANGIPVNFCEEAALDLLKQKEVNININLGLGTSNGVAWGCDLSYDYVKINAAYRT